MHFKLKSFFLLLVLFSFCNVIRAEEITCDYPSVGLTMTWDTQKPFDVNSNPYVNKDDFNSDSKNSRFLLWTNGKSVGVTQKAEIDQQLYKKVLDNYGCNDNFKLCVYSEAVSKLSVDSAIASAIDGLLIWNADYFDVGGSKQVLLIMTEEEYEKSGYAYYEGGKKLFWGSDEIGKVWMDDYQFGDVCKSIFYFLDGTPLIGTGLFSDHAGYKETVCETVTYDGPYVGVNINCTALSNKILEYQKTTNEYVSNCMGKFNNSECKISAYENLREVEDQINSQCRLIFANYNYTGGQKECINECINMDETLNMYKKTMDLYSVEGAAKCGLSANLIDFIQNIVKWVRYLVPVIVVVLGIIDFIKAIASEKDDEMKKAQGRFVKRLIAAALVFLIPLVIAFLLEQFGFVAKGCGIVNL